MASRLYRLAATRPGSRAAVTLSPSLGADLLGCINCRREKERKGKEALYIPAAYVLIRNHKSRYRLVQLNGDVSADPAYGETPPPLGCDPEVVTTHADAICTGPRSEKRTREERNKKTSKSDPVLHYFNFLAHAPTTIIPVYLGVGLC